MSPQAASALNLTQSAVSGAVAALEGRHGVQLFDRVGRGVMLNATGRAFLGEARSVLARAAAAELALEDNGHAQPGAAEHPRQPDHRGRIGCPSA